MQLEEFENKIKDLWMKPIDELENPEFIKYCDTFFETNNDIGFFYYKDQINFKKFHKKYMRDAESLSFDLENEIVLIFYDNSHLSGSNKLMLVTNKKIYYSLSKRRKGEIPLEYIKGKVEINGWLSHEIVINGEVLGKIDIYSNWLFSFFGLPFFKSKGKNILQNFFDGYFKQTDEKSVQSKSSSIFSKIIGYIIVIIILLVGVVIFDELTKDSEEDLIVQQVKYAELGSCPGKTLEEMAKGFMGSHSWSSGKSEDGMVFVDLKGDISFMEKKVSAVIQFKFNDDDTFKFNALEFNEIPQNNFMATSLLDKMCGRESSNEQESPNEQENPSEVDSSEL